MTNSIILAGIFVLIVALALACTPPEPVVERVEVTREVEVALAVPQTVEIRVPFPQTRIVEQTVEVTREVPITVVVTAAPPPVTAKPKATATPRPPSTRVPTRTPVPTPVDLATTSRSSLWIYLSDGDYGLTAMASPAFDADQFALDVFIDGIEYCNTSRIYSDDGPVELGCASADQSHRSVQRVSVQTPGGDLRCARNNQSTASQTIFACAWR